MKRIVIILIAVIFSFSCETLKVREPEVKTKTVKVHGDCNICHLPHQRDKEGKPLLNKPISELCASCHPDRIGQQEHAVGIKPPMPVEELPFDKEGKITCITCHDPHGEKGYEKLMRAKTFTDLCKKCHKSY